MEPSIPRKIAAIVIGKFDNKEAKAWRLREASWRKLLVDWGWRDCYKKLAGLIKKNQGSSGSRRQTWFRKKTVSRAALGIGSFEEENRFGEGRQGCTMRPSFIGSTLDDISPNVSVLSWLEKLRGTVA